MKISHLLLGMAALGSSLATAQQIEGLKTEGQVAFTEGPAYHAETDSVYFTDIENNRIMRRDSKGKMHIFKEKAGRANGLVLDKQGRIYACEGNGEGGNRRITRIEKDGTVTVLTDNYKGKRYNAPNDLTLDAKGRVYFTDPMYGDRSKMEIFPEGVSSDDKSKGIEGVYRIDLDGTVELIIDQEVERPNGIGISHDQKYLYVADNNNEPGKNRKLFRFDLNEDGTINPKTRKELFDWEQDRGPDGFDISKDGKLYVTAGFNFPYPKKHAAGIYIIAPEGGLEKFLPIPADMITNCNFGDKDGKTLYITAGHFLWSMPVE